MYRRNMAPGVLEALSDTPVVLVNGPRQAGKSTLVQEICGGTRPYLSLDDPEVLTAAQDDPFGFVAGLPRAVAIDEIQRVPPLFRALKREVDRDRIPGRFLLTGSADVLLLPNLAHELAGRMEIVTLGTLSQGELANRSEEFVDRLFEGERFELKASAVDDVYARIVAGGFPEAVGRRGSRRQAWFRAYVTTVVQREVREIADVEGLTQLPRLLALLAMRSGTLLNVAELSRTLGMAYNTLSRYLSLLRATFLYQPLEAWSANLGKRLAKSPKIHLCDTGLAAQLSGVGDAASAADSPLRGPLLESFVVSEIRKQIQWSRSQPSAFHYRTYRGEEVDLVLEDRGGRIVGIEVKAGRLVGPKDVAGLRALADALGDRFVRGVTVHTGADTVPFGERIHAIPVGALWRSSA